MTPAQRARLDSPAGRVLAAMLAEAGEADLDARVARCTADNGDEHYAANVAVQWADTRRSVVRGELVAYLAIGEIENMAPELAAEFERRLAELAKGAT